MKYIIIHLCRYYKEHFVIDSCINFFLQKISDIVLLASQDQGYGLSDELIEFLEWLLAMGLISYSFYAYIVFFSAIYLITAFLRKYLGGNFVFMVPVTIWNGWHARIGVIDLLDPKGRNLKLLYPRNFLGTQNIYIINNWLPIKWACVMAEEVNPSEDSNYAKCNNPSPSLLYDFDPIKDVSFHTPNTEIWSNMISSKGLIILTGDPLNPTVVNYTINDYIIIKNKLTQFYTYSRRV